MALNIKWTEEAKVTFENILIYLKKEWSDKEVEIFITRTENILSIISQQPYLYKASAHKEIRQTVVGKQNSLFYLVKNDGVLLLTFWDNRLNPVKNKYS